VLPNVRSVRFLVQLDGGVGLLSTLGFTRADESLYMIPYAPTGQYAGGWHDFPVGVSSISVPWSEELFEDVRQAPHISLHASGQVHAHAGGAKTGPVQVTPLREWRGQHAMSLTIDQFAGLARLWRGEDEFSPTRLGVCAARRQAGERKHALLSQRRGAHFRRRLLDVIQPQSSR
jgi:hypothetical protein